ncbi:hypothetical protein LQW54_013084 [Pestalotiopsis sp. IQ-011]
MTSLSSGRLADPGIQFEALSYTWGDPFDKTPIYIVGNRAVAFLMVPRNCFDALKALRLRDGTRILWIDAICINQNDLAERSSQVRMMARIFASASSTLIYVGKHTPSSLIVFRELSEAASGCIERCSYCNRFEPVRGRPSNEVIQGLEELIHRPWFRRVWVLQESFVSRERRILCGEDVVSWDMLNALFFGYQHSRMTPSPLPFAWEPRNALFKAEGSVWSNLWLCLHAVRGSLASDSRDKVFSLKALLGKEQDRLDQLIDYTKTAEEIFAALARIFLKAVGLKLLARIRHAHDLRMPSWVPDWSQCSPLPSPHVTFERFTKDQFDEVGVKRACCDFVAGDVDKSLN